MADKASATRETVAGKAVVFDVCFIRGAKASHTLHVALDSGVHVYVDVDAGRSPVALTLIHRPDGPVRYIKVPDGDAEPSYEPLSALAARIVALDGEGALQESRNALPIPGTVHWRGEGPALRADFLR